jgi:hypothetical protein
MVCIESQRNDKTCLALDAYSDLKTNVYPAKYILNDNFNQHKISCLSFALL